MSKKSKLPVATLEKPALPAPVKFSPEQNVANNLRSSVYQIKPAIKQLVISARGVLANGVTPTDGTIPVSGQGVKSALGEIDLETIQKMLDEYEAFADS